MTKQEQLDYLAKHASPGERLGLGNLMPLFEAMINAQQDGDPKPYALTVEVEDSEEAERKITTAQEVIDAYIAIANADPTAAPMVRAHLQGVVLEFTQMEITEGQVVATMAVAGEPDAHYTLTLTHTPGESAFRYVTPPQMGGFDVSTGVNFIGSQLEIVPDNTTGWDKLTNSKYMFATTVNPAVKTKITVFDKDMPELRDSSYMFYNCQIEEFISKLDNLEIATNMFSQGSEKDFSLNFKVPAMPKLKSANSMFGNSGLNNFDIKELPELENGENMFYLTNITEIDLSCPKLINGKSMFRLSKLRTAHLSMPVVQDITTMFQTAKELESIDIEFPEATACNQVFYNCYALKTARVIIPKATTLTQLFYGCKELTDVEIDISSSTSATSSFQSCSKLTNVKIRGTIQAPLTLSMSSLITVDSLMNVINALVDLTGQSQKTLTFGTTNLEKLSDEQKAVATDKNWKLA